MRNRGVAFLTGKGLVGLVAAVLAVGGSAVVATAATGSANPAAWGQHVKAAVEGCKDHAGNAGQCVSALAKQHGEKQSASGVNQRDGDNCEAGRNEPDGDNNDNESANESKVDNEQDTANESKVDDDQDEANESSCDNDQEGPNQAQDKDDRKAPSNTNDDQRQATENTSGKDDGNRGDQGHTPKPSPK